ncbi:DUF6624 domain-containing protein [Hymenobacter sp. APR13]|uniref:DUF6624 domain-containing protein n=1 Tax=Hymenobacter sp. APR13 TaxID=1356852 RepID=UPI0012E089A8|nr:DUF6624 domain-containing protein [Hymenobacter sp. APR13]
MPVPVDTTLRRTLSAIYRADQDIRRQYMQILDQSGRHSRPADSLGRLMQRTDSLNLQQVRQILDAHGWVSYQRIGSEANQALFLVIQHADLPTQQRYLPWLRRAVHRHEAQPSALALLQDRVALDRGRRQSFGSQIGFDEATNTAYVLPLRCPARVDARRRRMGLGPLAEYVRQYNITWNAAAHRRACRSKGSTLWSSH